MSVALTSEQALAALRTADLLYTPMQITEAFQRLGAAISAQLATTNPLVLVVMNGGFIVGAQLLQHLRFPLEVGYLHATRYRGAERGGSIHWIVSPPPSVAGRTVLIVDDIYDEGDTLQAIVECLRTDGAAAVYSAVLANKLHQRKVAGLAVDFIGLEVPDRYVFGCGMDYHEYWRQLPAIYAVPE